MPLVMLHSTILLKAALQDETRKSTSRRFFAILSKTVEEKGFLIVLFVTGTCCFKTEAISWVGLTNSFGRSK